MVYREGDQDATNEFDPATVAGAKPARIPAGPAPVDTAIVLFLVDGVLQILPMNRVPQFAMSREPNDGDLQSCIAQAVQMINMSTATRAAEAANGRMLEALKEFNARTLTEYERLRAGKDKTEVAL